MERLKKSQAYHIKNDQLPSRIDNKNVPQYLCTPTIMQSKLGFSFYLPRLPLKVIYLPVTSSLQLTSHQIDSNNQLKRGR